MHAGDDAPDPAQSLARPDWSLFRAVSAAASADCACSMACVLAASVSDAAVWSVARADSACASACWAWVIACAEAPAGLRTVYAPSYPIDPATCSVAARSVLTTAVVVRDETPLLAAWAAPPALSRPSVSAAAAASTAPPTTATPRPVIPSLRHLPRRGRLPRRDRRPGRAYRPSGIPATTGTPAGLRRTPDCWG